MGTGFRGTFVISWIQTELDGLRNAPRDALAIGALWAWGGQATCVDGPSDVLRLDHGTEAQALRRGAARKVRQLVGAAVTGLSGFSDIDVAMPVFDAGFKLTDGQRSYHVTLIEVGPGKPPLLMFVHDIPPKGTDLWIIEVNQSGPIIDGGAGTAPGVICFTPGTRISTPEGRRPVEDLRVGEKVDTRDNGPQEIVWVGGRRMSGARLFAMPALRPIRFGPGALGIDRPDNSLLVSPDHRVLIRSRAVSALFNTPEVLVTARDLINDATIAADTSLREVSYIHLMLANHQVLWANGVECESFHPAGADLALLTQDDRQRLQNVSAALMKHPEDYGAYARRTLTPAETAILLHDAA